VFDETWFLTIVYVSAKQLALETNNPKHSQDATVLMDMVLDKLGQNVANAGEGQLPSDATICAVSCLVTLEVCSSQIACLLQLRRSNASRYITDTAIDRTKEFSHLESTCERHGGARASARGFTYD
jgi:hypothetical protein